MIHSGLFSGLGTQSVFPDHLCRQWFRSVLHDLCPWVWFLFNWNEITGPDYLLYDKVLTEMTVVTTIILNYLYILPSKSQFLSVYKITYHSSVFVDSLKLVVSRYLFQLYGATTTPVLSICRSFPWWQLLNQVVFFYFLSKSLPTSFNYFVFQY